MALQCAHRGYVLELGTTVMNGTPIELKEQEQAKTGGRVSGRVVTTRRLASSGLQIAAGLLKQSLSIEQGQTKGR